jgi:hypothetical protein
VKSPEGGKMKKEVFHMVIVASLTACTTIYGAVVLFAPGAHQAFLSLILSEWRAMFFSYGAGRWFLATVLLVVDAFCVGTICLDSADNIPLLRLRNSYEEHDSKGRP